MQTYLFETDKIKMGKKGQITIPKKIRDEEGFEEYDTFIISSTPGGDIIMRRKKMHTPEDTILDAIKNMPPFDAREAWREVKEERKRERA